MSAEKTIFKVGEQTFWIESAPAAGVVQLNAMPAPGGIGCFVVFPAGEGEAAMTAMKHLLETTELEPGVNLSDKVPGCIVAGTGDRSPIRIAVDVGLPDEA